MVSNNRTLNRLAAVSLKKLPDGCHADGGNLYLLVRGLSRSWVFRYVGLDGRRKNMGLGPLQSVSLAEARKQATSLREQLKHPIKPSDPLIDRQQRLRALKAAQLHQMTFEGCANAYMKAHEGEWKNTKHGLQWQSTLASYVYPVFGDLLVGAVDEALILKALTPIWNTKTETAKRIRGRIEAVLDWATFNKYRQGENPARWKGHLEHSLAKPSKVAKVKHHPALSYKLIAGFMSELRKRDGVPITPEVVACPHCRKVQWVNDLEEVGEIPGPRGFGVPRPEYNKTFDHQPFIELPFADDYLEFLKSEKLLNDQEQYLRWMYWHLMNDSRRNASEAPPLSLDEVKNLKRLLALIELGNESSRLTIAEIHRELGDFDSCEKVLDHDFSEELIPAAQTIYFLQEEKISVVKPIFNDEAFIDAWNYRRKISNVELELDLPFDPSGPPIFEIKSCVWWIKILGMLQHNWALIEESGTGAATVFFFHDGEVGMRGYGYSREQLKGRYAVVDSLNFDSVQLAKDALSRNGFRLHENWELLGSDVKPRGNFYDVRSFEEGIYSSQGHWTDFK